MDKLADKIEDAKRIVNEALLECKKPVLYFSAGKDSTVVAHLLKFRLGLELPVVFHREPWMGEKYLFGLALLAEWGMTSYDYPPFEVSMWLGKNGTLAFNNRYQIGRDGENIIALDLPKNIEEPKTGKPFLCGKVDILQRPLGLFNFQWDLGFLGSKSSDEDQIAGKVPLSCDILRPEIGIKAAFPLRQWSDSDVWTYLDRNKVPVQDNRYDRVSRTELKDKTYNSDYFAACFKCCDRRIIDTKVSCPKLGGEMIDNISERVPYVELKHSYCGIGD